MTGTLGSRVAGELKNVAIRSHSRLSLDAIY